MLLVDFGVHCGFKNFLMEKRDIDTEYKKRFNGVLNLKNQRIFAIAESGFI
jgi:hypothetical protein